VPCIYPPVSMTCVYFFLILPHKGFCAKISIINVVGLENPTYFDDRG